jgi:hypothetical protein
MTKQTRCGLCAAYHSEPEPRNEWGSPAHLAQSATEAAVALAIANPEVFHDAWNDAVNVYTMASRLEDDINLAYKKADRKTRALLRPIRDRQRRIVCKAIAALWHIPHPSQIHQERIGCLLV